MNKKLLASLLLVGLVAGCGETKESSKTSSQASSSVTSSVTTSVTSEESSKEENSSVLPSSSSESSKEESSSSSSTTKDSSSNSSSNQNEESSSIVESSNNNSSIEESSSSSSSSTTDTSKEDSSSDSSSSEESSSQTPSYNIEWYLRGDVNSWGTTEEYKFNPVSGENGKFALANDVTFAIGDQFKVANTDWTIQLNYTNLIGSAASNFAPNGNDNNIKCTVAGDYSIIVDAINSTIDVTCTKLSEDQTVVYQTEWYLRGGMNGWGTTDSYKFTLVDGEQYKYSLETTIMANQEFKVACEEWGDGEFSYSNLTDSAKTLCSNASGNIKVNKSGDYLLTIDVQNETLDVELLSEITKPTEETIVTLYFSAPDAWGEVVNAYVWDSATGTASSGWPGSPMTYVSTNTYNQRIFSVEVDLSKYDYIIFNNGTHQTADINILNVADNTNYWLADNSQEGTSCQIGGTNIYTPTSTTNLGVLPDEGYGPLH